MVDNLLDNFDFFLLYMVDKMFYVSWDLSKNFELCLIKIYK
jgi:hypothetical protein